MNKQGVGIRFDFTEVAQKLHRLREDTGDRHKALTNGLRNAGRLVLKKATAAAPTGPGSSAGGFYSTKRTNPRQVGTLKSSGYVNTTQRDRRTGLPRARVGFGDMTAHLVEYGHLSRASGGATKHTIPRPFLRPALEGSDEEILDRIEAAITRYLDKVLK